MYPHIQSGNKILLDSDEIHFIIVFLLDKNLLHKLVLFIIMLKEHEIHISDHKMLPIEDDLAPERYDVQQCLTHSKHVLDEICKHCMMQFCKRCETRERCAHRKPQA